MCKDSLQYTTFLFLPFIFYLKMPYPATFYSKNHPVVDFVSPDNMCLNARSNKHNLNLSLFNCVYFSFTLLYITLKCPHIHSFILGRVEILTPAETSP